MITVIHYGKSVYMQSGTMLSGMEFSTGQRADWGNIQGLLDKGETVTIRPATTRELDQYEIKLARQIIRNQKVA